MDWSLTDSVHGILQARGVEWVAIPFSRVSSLLRDCLVFLTKEGQKAIPVEKHVKATAQRDRPIKRQSFNH